MSRRTQAARKPVHRLLAVTVAALILVISGTALAKGPLSVVISGPGIDSPIVIELTDNGTDAQLVVRLMEQTGLWYATGDLPRPIEEPVAEFGSGHTLTWIGFGPPGESVEEHTIRQVIYLDTEGGPIIHIPEQEGLEGWGPGVVGWFAAPSGLAGTLAELGFPSPSEPERGLGAAWLVGRLTLTTGIAWTAWRLFLRRRRTVA